VLEADGHFLAAAALYRQNLAAQDAAPAGKFLLRQPANEWANLGIALYGARDMDGAAQAYERGLRANAAAAAVDACIEAEDPRWRENARCRLLLLIIDTLCWRKRQSPPRGDVAALDVRIGGVMQRIFEDHLEAALAEDERRGAVPLRAGVDPLAVAMYYSYAQPWCELLSSGRRFVLHRTLRAGSHNAEQFHIEELPRGAPLPPLPGAAGGAGSSANSQLGPEGVLRARQQAFRLPALPAASCARCGARCAATKRCARCMQVAYCDKACQAAHWAEHRPECRRAPAGEDSAAGS
jgi:hypothetical protein